MAKVNYIFCKYFFTINDEKISEEAEYAFISENQGSEADYGRNRNGVMPTALFTQPKRLMVEGVRVHSFEIGVKPNIRVKQEYNSDSKNIDATIEYDTHTKFGHIISIPNKGIMAVRNKGGETKIYANQTITALKSLILEHTRDDEETNSTGNLQVTFAESKDIDRAFDVWEINQYSFTARPVNPSAKALGLLRTKAYKSENIAKERSVLVAEEGKSLAPNGGIIDQTKDMYDHGYAQLGLSGRTRDGKVAKIQKSTFHMDKAKNFEARSEKPIYISVAFDDEDDDIVISVSNALMVFYNDEEQTDTRPDIS